MFYFLPKVSTPIATNYYPEDDSTDFLSDDEYKKYQMLIGMLV